MKTSSFSSYMTVLLLVILVVLYLYDIMNQQQVKDTYETTSTPGSNSTPMPSPLQMLKGTIWKKEFNPGVLMNFDTQSSGYFIIESVIIPFTRASDDTLILNFKQFLPKQSYDSLRANYKYVVDPSTNRVKQFTITELFYPTIGQQMINNDFPILLGDYVFYFDAPVIVRGSWPKSLATITFLPNNNASLQVFKADPNFSKDLKISGDKILNQNGNPEFRIVKQDGTIRILGVKDELEQMIGYVQ